MDHKPTPEEDQTPRETGGVVRLSVSTAWLDWWVKGRFEGEAEPAGRVDGGGGGRSMRE